MANLHLHKYKCRFYTFQRISRNEKQFNLNSVAAANPERTVISKVPSVTRLRKRASVTKNYRLLIGTTNVDQVRTKMMLSKYLLTRNVKMGELSEPAQE